MNIEALTRLAGPRWININVDALEHNFREVKKLLRPTTKFLAVVKADAYGAGAVECARIFLTAGADYLGVGNLAEGLELRQAGIEAPILVMSPLLPEELPAAIENNLTLTVSSRAGVQAVLAAAADANCRVSVHIKVETGLQRTGLPPGEIVPIVKDILAKGRLEIEGIYSHLAAATQKALALQQLECFQGVLDELEAENITLPLRHICNSGGLLIYPEKQLDLVRIGTLLYGQFPYRAPTQGLQLMDGWDFKARIIFVHNIKAGTAVGYGGDYVVKKPTRVAVIPVGYADGFALTAISRPKGLNDLIRHLAKTVLAFLGRGRGEGMTVNIDGCRAPVIGRVGMQLTMIDISCLPEVKVGQEVQADLRRLAAGTHIPRVYWRAGRIYSVRTASGDKTRGWAGFLPRAANREG